MAYTVWQARRLAHKANQRLYTILRITWEKDEGSNMQKHFWPMKVTSYSTETYGTEVVLLNLCFLSIRLALTGGK